MKKEIEEYMNTPYRMLITPDECEGGYTISFPDLPGCISVGETIEEAYQNANDAKLAWFTAAMEENIHIPKPGSYDEYSGQFKLRLPKSLHKELAENAKLEGVSMNQYCVYLLSMNNARHIFLEKKRA